MDDFLGIILPTLLIAVLLMFLMYKPLNNFINKWYDKMAVKTAAKHSAYDGERKNVVIKEVGKNKLCIIRYISAAAGMKINDAKAVVESQGTIEELPIKSAEYLVQIINDFGGVAELK